MTGRGPEMARRVQVRRLQASERLRGFMEIDSTLSPQWAVAEANRCILCNEPPCEQGCPVGVPVKQFIRFMRSRNFRSAIQTIREKNVLVGVCARVCPQSELCEKECSSTELAEPIAVGALQRFVADEDRRKPLTRAFPKQETFRVAVVGSGPAGLSCAYQLALRGLSVVVFEKMPRPGGLMVYGIPPYRLPRDVLEAEIEIVRNAGVEIRTDAEVHNLDDLFSQGFSCIFVGTGLVGVRDSDLSREGITGLMSWRDFLLRTNEDLYLKQEPRMRPGERTLVVGGGNAAIDCARTARRLGARVTILYRRREEDMPAWKEEVAQAKEEGVEFVFQALPTKYISSDGNLTAVECKKTAPGEIEESGRRGFVVIENSSFTIEADTVIEALGQEGRIPGGLSEYGRTGLVKVDENYMTERPGVFAGGDLINGGKTVVRAVADGYGAAQAIEKWMRSNVFA